MSKFDCSQEKLGHQRMRINSHFEDRRTHQLVEENVAEIRRQSQDQYDTTIDHPIT